MRAESAQEALDKHPTAKVAHVNEDGEWHFSTPPTGFIVKETLKKGEVKKDVDHKDDKKDEAKSKKK